MDNKMIPTFIFSIILSISLSNFAMAQTPELITAEGAEAGLTSVKNDDGQELAACTEADIVTTNEKNPISGMITTTVQVQDPKKCYPTTNLLYLGISGGSIFHVGASALFVHWNAKKNRPVYQLEYERAKNSFVTTNTIGAGFNIGRQGFFVGPKVGTLTVTNYLINGSPSFSFWVAGLDVGIYHAWGKKKRLITGLKISSLFVPDPNSPVITLEGRGFFAIRFGR